MPKAVVTGVDTYSYVEDGLIVRADRDETIYVSADELARGLDLDALSKPGSKAAKDAAAEDTGDAAPADADADAAAEDTGA